MKYLFILNEAPYGTERSYNALRLAGSLSKKENIVVKMFLMGDAASCAKKGQKVPQGYYNVEIMLKNVIRNNSEIGVCGTCMEARGITDQELIEGTSHSTLDALSNMTIWADKVLIFKMNRKEKIIKLYDNRAKEYDDWFEHHNDVFQKELALLREHLVFIEKSLEVGIGSGRFTSALRISKGIDPSLKMIKLCNEKGIDAVLGVAEKLPFDSSEFEQVFFITSLCFVEDVDMAIAEANRVLKNDGVVTIAFIDKNSAMGRMYQENRGEYFEEAVLLTANELLVKMEQFRFENFKVSGINFNNSINKPPFDFCVMSFRKIFP